MRVLKQPFALTCLIIIGGYCGHAAAVSDELVKSCDACHGTNGVSKNTNIPSIAGIAEWNLSDQMLQYLDGRPAKTVNHVLGDTSKSGNMKTVVEGLSEDQINDLAKYYSSKPFVKAKQTFDGNKAAAGKEVHMASCDKCHSKGGSDPFDEASILAGQQKGYILRTMNEYKGGQRQGAKGMVDAIKALSADDISALVEFYASQQ
ncbi:c-type cytochrome [Photobacterium gaetbulicola]|uniref:c-type cytochrome n=1 Tax=Photobacterium gaetbulicola TaxID=1295392 RepID=UPI000689B962|nr:c-type cytochrome [Photobacterium gaetbulicola]